jgi:RNA-directed DNA polymerase
MSLERRLTTAIKEEAKKLILRFHAHHNAVHEEYKRNTRRIANPPKKVIKTRDYWNKDPKHNPFYVYRKAKSIARSISAKIERRGYQPNKPVELTVDKPSGGTRTVTVYQVPDAAVSKYFYNRLLSKNIHRFSSFSYAYRKDRNVHFAIQDVAIGVSQEARTFVAEFDFSDFFGSISHEYLERQFHCNGFSISDEEEHVIKAFLGGAGKGIPQGTAISLFLANLTCWRLDKELEAEGLRFARYADDTVIWSRDYQKICRAFSIITAFSDDAGVAINIKKSAGISLLSREGLPSELMHCKSNIDFLGYSIHVDKVSIKSDSVRNIQARISYLLYRNLIQPLKGTVLRGLVIPANNRDAAFTTAIMQVRRYLYGGLTGQHLRNYIGGRTKRIYFKGIMNFYPLVTDEEQLKALDGWLLSTIHRSLQLRGRLLRDWGYDRFHTFPFNVGRNELLVACRRKIVHQKRLLEIPSFMLLYRAWAKGLISEGMDKIARPLSDTGEYRRQ